MRGPGWPRRQRRAAAGPAMYLQPRIDHHCAASRCRPAACRTYGSATPAGSSTSIPARHRQLASGPIHHVARRSTASRHGSSVASTITSGRPAIQASSARANAGGMSRSSSPVNAARSRARSSAGQGLPRPVRAAIVRHGQREDPRDRRRSGVGHHQVGELRRASSHPGRALRPTDRRGRRTARARDPRSRRHASARLNAPAATAYSCRRIAQVARLSRMRVTSSSRPDASPVARH